MKGLELGVLGGLSMALEGAPLGEVRHAKAKALLCFLAVSGGVHARAALAGLLWSELPEDDARANLRVTLMELRRALPDYLAVDRQTVAFSRTHPYSLDLEGFLADLDGYDAEPRTERLKRAVARYRGDFLEGFYVHDAPLFEEWVAGQRERLRGLVLGALHTLATFYAEGEDYLTATDYLTRLLNLDPWREAAHRDLMELLALSGRPEAALAQFKTLRGVLREALGLEPGPETASLAERIRNGEFRSEAPAPTRHNLPRPLTPLLGREAQLGLLTRQLGDPDTRLVTLAGPGGVGKTRLGLELAWGLRGAFGDGVYLVSLAPVADAASVVTTVARTLGLRETAGEPPEHLLRAFLRDRQVLLLLDNFEHVLGAAPAVAELLAACPGLKVVVTSRTPLRLRGEREAVVPPLRVPDPPVGAAPRPSGRHPPEAGEGGRADPTGLLGYASVQLFAERTQAIREDFVLDSDNAPAVAELCRRLDGLPLALELAAARGKLWSPQEILARLGDRLDLLDRGAVDLPARHRSLRATLAWSYDLLTPQEQRLFRRLGVTVGGCDLSLAAALWRAGAGAARGSDDELEVFELLDALAAQSLLRRDEGVGELRVTLLETVKTFSAEKLAEDPAEADASREALAAHLAARLDDLIPELRNGEKGAMRAVARELGNLRAAWLWAAAQRRRALMRPTPLFDFFVSSGRYREGIRLFAEAADLLGHDGDAEMAGRLYGSLAWLHFKIGDIGGATGAAERSVSALRRLGRPELTAVALETLAGILYGSGAYTDAERTHLEALELYQRLGLQENYVRCLSNLGLVADAQGNYPEALRLHRQMYDWYASLARAPVHTGTTLSLTLIGGVYRRMGDVAASRGVLEEAYALSRDLEDIDARVCAAYDLGLTRLALGDAGRAVVLLGEALERALTAGDALQVARAHVGLAQAVQSTDVQGAAAHLHEALVAVNDTGLMPELLHCLLGVAELWRSLARHDEADVLFALVRDHPAGRAYDRRRAGRQLEAAGAFPDVAREVPDLDGLSQATLARLGELIGAGG